MQCPHCGAQCQEHDTFCVSCGSSLTAPAAQQPVNSQPVYQPPVQPTYAPPVGSIPVGQPSHMAQPDFATKVQNKMKEIAGSPVFLVAIILQTVALFCNMFGIFTSSNMGMLTDALEEAGLPADAFGDLEDVLGGTNFFLTLLTNLPSILTVLGLWLVYASAKGEGVMSTAGLTIINVVQVIGLVLMGIVFLILFGSLFTMCSAVERYSGYGGSVEDSAQSMIFFLFLLIAGIAVFVVLYYVKIMGSLGAAKDTIASSNPNPNASGFVGVMCFISGGFSAIGLLMAFTLPALMSVVSTFLFGSLVFTYRNAMSQLQTEKHMLSASMNQARAQASYQAQNTIPAWKHVEDGQ